MSQIYRLFGARDLRLEPHDLPPLGRHDLHLRSRLGAISSGTESAWYFGTDPQLDPGYRPIRFPHPTFPRFLGYEKVAEVVAVGEEVTGFEVGQRVIAAYGHAEEMIWPANKTAPIPTSISDEEAVFSTLMNVASHGVRRSGMRLGDTVLITGQGIVGIATLIAARLAGAGNIIITDLHTDRLALARRFGADVLHNPVNGPLTDRLDIGEIDIAFECSASYEALADALAVTKRNGKVVVIAQLRGQLPSHPLFGVDFHLGELELISSDGGWDLHKFANWYFGAIERGMIRHMGDLITHRVPFAELIRGFELLEQKPKEVLKVAVTYR